MAFFEGLVVTEDGTPVDVADVGQESYYVVDDEGFRRHIDARSVDQVVLSQFASQLIEHRDEASEAMLKLIGQDDLFTKAMVDSTLRNISLEQVMAHKLPPEALQWLGMMGFKIVINVHGEVVRVDMPAPPEGLDGEE